MNLVSTLSNVRMLAVFSGIVILTGCGTSPTHVDKQFGQSVRNMIQEQVYDAETLKNPPLEVVEGLDGAKATNTLRRLYRPQESSKREAKTSALPGMR